MSKFLSAIAERCHRLLKMVKVALASLSKKTWLDEVEDGILAYIEGIYFENI